MFQIFDMFNPFKVMARMQRDTLLFFRTMIDMEISFLNAFLGEAVEKEEKEKKKKEVKKVEIK